jgi:hypothetical protein
MASIFKRRYTKLVDGKRVKKQSAKWHIKFFDAIGRERRVTGLRDKLQSQALAKQIERLVRCSIAGERPTAQLSRWLEQIPDELRSKLVKFGLLEATRIAAQKPLSEHIEAFKKSLEAKDRTEGYVSETTLR